MCVGLGVFVFFLKKTKNRSLKKFHKFTKSPKSGATDFKCKWWMPFGLSPSPSVVAILPWLLVSELCDLCVLFSPSCHLCAGRSGWTGSISLMLAAVQHTDKLKSLCLTLCPVLLFKNRQTFESCGKEEGKKHILTCRYLRFRQRDWLRLPTFQLG